MEKPTLLTVILNYKTAEMTLQSLAAALMATQEIDGEIIVVDNDSQDGSYELLSKTVQDKGWATNGRVRVLQSGRNGGFGAGNNVGIKAGLSTGEQPDFIYILNSDAFPNQETISELLNYLMAHPKVGFAGSYIHGQDGMPHLTAFRFPSIAGEFEGAIKFGPVSRLLKNSVVPLPLPRETCQVDWLAGASLMMRQKVLDKIGLFDERFFLYFEETDLCRRALLAGWPTVYVRSSEISHIGSVSTGMKNWTRMPQYWFDSRRYYYVKNHGAFYAKLATLAHLAGGVLCHLRHILQGKPLQGPKYFLRDLARHSLTADRHPLRHIKTAALKETCPAGEERK
jgi:GT2 family glycosyltransferase